MSSSVRHACLQQLRLQKIRDQLFMYIVEKDGFVDKQMARHFDHMLCSYSYLESLIKNYGSF